MSNFAQVLLSDLINARKKAEAQLTDFCQLQVSAGCAKWHTWSPSAPGLKSGGVVNDYTPHPKGNCPTRWTVERCRPEACTWHQRVSTAADTLKREQGHSLGEVVSYFPGTGEEGFYRLR